MQSGTISCLRKYRILLPSDHSLSEGVFGFFCIRFKTRVGRGFAEVGPSMNGRNVTPNTHFCLMNEHQSKKGCDFCTRKFSNARTEE